MQFKNDEIELLLIALDSIIVPDEIQRHPQDRTTSIKKRTIRKLKKMQKEITAKIITISDKPPTLEEMQDMVGGYVEEIHAGDPDKQYFVNEEGLLKNLKFNVEASGVVGRDIVGNMVVLEGKAIWD